MCNVKTLKKIAVIKTIYAVLIIVVSVVIAVLVLYLLFDGKPTESLIYYMILAIFTLPSNVSVSIATFAWLDYLTAKKASKTKELWEISPCGGKEENT